MSLNFSDIKSQLYKEHGVEFEICPVGAQYIHGIRHVQESFMKSINNHRLSNIQRETIEDQRGTSINSLPIAVGPLYKN